MSVSNLDNDLYDSPFNKENLKLLLEQFDADHFVAFLGAGICSSIRGVPTSEELCERLKDKYSIIDNADFSGPKSFSYIYKKCKDKNSFDDNVFNMVKSKITSGPMTTYYIIKAFNCYVTTNYYDPIEDNFENITRVRLRKYFFKLPVLFGHQEENSITYLHGHPDLGFCILREKDYEYFYPSLYDEAAGVYTIENSLNYLLKNKHLVFLGYSLEGNLKKYLESFLAKYKAEAKEHFWIISQNNIPILRDPPKEKKEKEEAEKEFFSKYYEIKIRPIIYKDDAHIFIERLSQVLSVKKERKLSREQPDTSRI